MRPPNACDPLEKLVDRLREQLDVLCSQSQEHLFLQSLIDLPSLADMTRAMLKDAETRLANCRRHPIPPSNGPFLVTPNCPRRIIKTDHARARTTLWTRVAACVVIGVLALSLGYARYEDRVAQRLVAQVSKNVNCRSVPNARLLKKGTAMCPLRTVISKGQKRNQQVRLPRRRSE